MAPAVNCAKKPGTFRRQRHGARRLDRIELARDEHRELAGIADAARHARGLVPGAEIDIGPRRADDGRPGILREHQAAKFRAALVIGDRQDPPR